VSTPEARTDARRGRAVAARTPDRAGTTRLRIGLLAPELSDGHGGMPEYARQLARELARHDDVTVYTARDAHLSADDWEQRAILERDLRGSLAALRTESPDVWFACNCALVALAPGLDAPLLAFVNGNDVLNPWLVYQRPWLDSLAQQRVLWRFAPALRTALRTRDMRRGLRAAAGLIANSTNTAAILSRVHPGFEDRTVVIPPGVADDFFQEPEPRDHSVLNLLTVARLEQWTARKNVDGVLRALALLPDLRVRYTVVGDGDDRVRLEALAAELGIAANVAFRGALPREALRACYRESDLFIMAARARKNDVEGFGIVYLEAAAAGVPVICSVAGGATDAVRDGVSGIVLDGSEPDDIAAGIRRFLRERDRFDPVGVRSFAEEFRWTRIAERVRAELAHAGHRSDRRSGNDDDARPSARHAAAD
jgi:phosphatidyl-myo-inositol dimannoside synthase